MTPGTYLRLRRENAGWSVEDLALALDSEIPVSARRRAEEIAAIEADAAVIGADFVNALRALARATLADDRAYRLDPHVLFHLIAVHAGSEIDPPRVCRVCACSWADACLDPATGQGCAWSADDPGLCTSCPPAPAPLPASAAA